MFDLFSAIFGAFGGRVSHDSQARKLVWVLILFAVLTASISVFTAYMSYSRYNDLIKFMPNAVTVAWYISGFIAVAMMLITGVLGLFTIELWLTGESRIAWQAAAILAVIGLFIGITDFSMNVQGADDVAEAMAGTVQGVDDQAIFDRYDSQIANHQARINEVYKKYTWKGKLWFKSSKYHPAKEYAQDTSIVNNAQRQIAALEASKTIALKRDISRFDQDSAKRKSRKESSHQTLLWAVRLAYILQFLVMLGLAYCTLIMEQALESSPKPPLFKAVNKSNGVTSFSPEALENAINDRLSEMLANWSGEVPDSPETHVRVREGSNLYQEPKIDFNTGTSSDSGKMGFEQGYKKGELKIHESPVYIREYARRIEELEKQIQEKKRGLISRKELEEIAEDLRKEFHDILGSMSPQNGTEYLYRFFNKDDAAKSRDKKASKAEEARQRAIELKKQGLSYEEISNEIGKSTRQIKRYLNQKKS